MAAMQKAFAEMKKIAPIQKQHQYVKMTHILLHFVSNRYKFELMRYKKSANAEIVAEM